MNQIDDICSISNCDRDIFATGLCSAHYQRKYNGWSDEEMLLPIGHRNRKISPSQLRLREMKLRILDGLDKI